jgi:hypothetical protein
MTGAGLTAGAVIAASAGGPAQNRPFRDRRDRIFSPRAPSRANR